MTGTPYDTAQTMDPALFEAAVAVREHAYAPYSKFKVGAALRTVDGTIYAGANCENASYPVGVCAEGVAIGAMASAGERRMAEIVVIGGDAGDSLLCTPCGACRQRIREFAAPETPVHVCGPEGLRRSFTLAELLPSSFGPENLTEDTSESV